MLRICPVLLVIAACGGTPASQAPDAEPGAPDAGPAFTETRQLQLSPGQFVEAEFEAGPGDRIHVTMTAATPTIAWNIHGHAGGGVQTIVEEDDVMAVDYWFEPDSQADWWLMPGNSGAETLTIDVTMDFYGGATFTEWL